MEDWPGELDRVESQVAVQVLTSLTDPSSKLGLTGAEYRRGGRVAVQLLLEQSFEATRVDGGLFTAGTATERIARYGRDLASIHGFSQPLVSTQGCPFLPLSIAIADRTPVSKR